jgi:hypothetical protein
MNRLAYFLILTALLISCHSKNAMKPDDFPPCDPDDPHPENEPVYRDPPQPEDPGMMTFWGLESGDKDYEAVTVPSDTTPQEIIRNYNVGLQAGISYGYDEEETCALLIEKVNAITRIIPFRVIFADSAGLKLRFTRQITASELKKSKLFSRKRRPCKPDLMVTFPIGVAKDLSSLPYLRRISSISGGTKSVSPAIADKPDSSRSEWEPWSRFAMLPAQPEVRFSWLHFLKPGWFSPKDHSSSCRARSLHPQNTE